MNRFDSLHFLAIYFLLIALPCGQFLVDKKCVDEEIYEVTELIPHQEKQTVKVGEYMCFDIPPWCNEFEDKWMTVHKSEVMEKTRNVSVCCEGYKPYENKCEPVCSQVCIQGQCEAPNKCTCYEGWKGDTCSSKEGTPLERNNTFFSDMKTDSLNKSNIHGKECTNDTWGYNCEQICQCQNGDACDSESGQCSCTTDWTGNKCQNKCASGYYGINCESTCSCVNNAECNHLTGECICPNGYSGNQCQLQCIEGQYGLNCAEKCQCENLGSCSPISGECACPLGWLGANCQRRLCPYNRFGPGCLHECTCNVQQTSQCHPWSGECKCREGWSGKTCDQNSFTEEGTPLERNNTLFSDMKTDSMNKSNIPGKDLIIMSNSSASSAAIDQYLKIATSNIYIGASFVVIVSATFFICVPILVCKCYKQKKKLEIAQMEESNFNDYRASIRAKFSGECDGQFKRNSEDENDAKEIKKSEFETHLSDMNECIHL